MFQVFLWYFHWACLTFSKCLPGDNMYPVLLQFLFSFVRTVTDMTLKPSLEVAKPLRSSDFSFFLSFSSHTINLQLRSFISSNLFWSFFHSSISSSLLDNFQEGPKRTITNKKEAHDVPREFYFILFFHVMFKIQQLSCICYALRLLKSQLLKQFSMIWVWGKGILPSLI